MTEWHSTKEAPAPHLFEKECEDDDHMIARVFVAVEHNNEPCKGTCIKRKGRPLKWQADGHLGDLNIYAWTPMPELPTPPAQDD